MSVDLTSREAQILINWRTNYDNAEAEKADNASWTEAADMVGNGISIKTVKGLLGSLAKKGLVEGGHEKANGEPGDLQILTDAGIDEVFRLRAELKGAELPEGIVADTVAFLAAQTEPAVDAACANLDQEAAEALLDAESEAEAEPAGEEAEPAGEEAEAEKATPREKLVLLALDGTVLTSRRIPTVEAAALVLSLVEKFGGGQATPVETIHAAGIDAEALHRASKRIKSWFGAGRTSHGKDGFIINLQLRA